MTRTASLRRPALTLVELLVVVALIIVLAGLAVAVGQSGVFGSQKVIHGADRASGWLLVARQRAMRDGLPRGVRFLLKPVQDPALNPTNDPTYFAVTEAQYNESPEVWVPNPNPGGKVPPDPTLPEGPKGPRIALVSWTTGTTTTPNNQTPNNRTYRQVYFTTDPSRQVQDLGEFDQRVMVGDFLVLPELQAICRIAAINNTTANVTIGGVVHPARLLVLEDNTYPDLGANNSGPLPATPPAAPPSCRVVYEFGFQPAPRPLIGEPMLQLTGGTIIDCRMRTTPNLALVTDTTLSRTTTIGVWPVADGAGGYYFDILFAPSGNVMFTPGGIICLWVRDPSKTPHPRWDLTLGPAGLDARSAYDAAGEQALVTIFTHTGVIATYPPAYAPDANGDPYRYAKDGVNSGF
jgi:type II secretory pathway pseudopilin PulG